ncbi:MAG: FAD-dependent oxidoreductase [Nocardiopsaceae bacterium]|nr:FAD-dependent oxidoreductase [Nocardiopsaceae bacterium]
MTGRGWPSGGRAIVLVGGGQASASAARTLRRRGYDGAIVVIGDEPHPPYQRPPLSKEYLATGDDSSLDLLPEKWCADNAVEVRTGARVVAVSPPDGGVVLDDGSSVRADAVLLATGARPRRLPGSRLPGSQSPADDGVCYLRSRDDADRLRPRLAPGRRLVIIGGGFIGGEVASAALERGAAVTVLEAGPAPLAQAIGPRLGAAYARLVREAGVDLRTGASVTGVRRVRSGRLVVATSRGDVEADAVVAGIGAVPNSDLAAGSGIDADDGILVDEYCRTSHDRVFAAGDVARHAHPGAGGRIRVEHFDNASRQGAVAARNMLGEAVPYDDPHWFWSDQFGRNLQHVGHAGAGDRMVVRGSLDEDSWTAFFVSGDTPGSVSGGASGGRVTAAFALDNGEDIAVARELISLRAREAGRGRLAGEARLADEILADPQADLIEAMEELA